MLGVPYEDTIPEDEGKPVDGGEEKEFIRRIKVVRGGQGLDLCGWGSGEVGRGEGFT